MGLAAGIAVIAIAIMAVVIIRLSGTQMEQQTDQSTESVTASSERKRDVLVTEDNVKDIIEESAPAKENDAKKYTVTMTTFWSFENSQAASENAYVKNSTDNSYSVYFDVELADSQEVIYASPVLPVGAEIMNIKLDKALENGSYDCVMIYHLIDDDQNTLSTVRVALKIKVGA